jgi:hypothetical protein
MCQCVPAAIKVYPDLERTISHLTTSNQQRLTPSYKLTVPSIRLFEYKIVPPPIHCCAKPGHEQSVKNSHGRQSVCPAGAQRQSMPHAIRILARGRKQPQFSIVECSLRRTKRQDCRPSQSPWLASQPPTKATTPPLSISRSPISCCGVDSSDRRSPWLRPRQQAQWLCAPTAPRPWAALRCTACPARAARTTAA